MLYKNLDSLTTGKVKIIFNNGETVYCSKRNGLVKNLPLTIDLSAVENIASKNIKDLVFIAKNFNPCPAESTAFKYSFELSFIDSIDASKEEGFTLNDEDSQFWKIKKVGSSLYLLLTNSNISFENYQFHLTINDFYLNTQNK